MLISHGPGEDRNKAFKSCQGIPRVHLPQYSPRKSHRILLADRLKLISHGLALALLSLEAPIQGHGQKNPKIPDRRIQVLRQTERKCPHCQTRKGMRMKGRNMATNMSSGSLKRVRIAITDGDAPPRAHPNGYSSDWRGGETGRRHSVVPVIILSVFLR